MLDIKFIHENLDLVKRSIKNRGLDLDLDALIGLDDTRRKVLVELEGLRQQKNKANDEITALLKQKKDAKEKIASMKNASNRIDKLDDELRKAEADLNRALLTIPNVPHSSVPVGDASKKEVVRTWGKAKEFGFKPLNHMELANSLDIIDFSRAAKITGSNFTLFKGAGARLERALINFMLDLHTKKHGYTEVFPPFLVNRSSMTGTGQLPKLEEDMYRLKDDDLFLVPTAEVPVTNIFRDEILDENELPKYFTAYTACFRREAGSYGKDTKGLVRVHQFDKVELVKFVAPETSYDELEKLVKDAEEVLQGLGLLYRVVLLPSGDLGFSAAKCYDIEIYAPGTDAWLEVSSCSNFEDFQARRANIRYRLAVSGERGAQTANRKPQIKYVHTLNGSGVALARLVIALLETYQEPDGSIVLPEILSPYMGGTTRIGAAL